MHTIQHKSIHFNNNCETNPKPCIQAHCAISKFRCFEEGAVKVLLKLFHSCIEMGFQSFFSPGGSYAKDCIANSSRKEIFESLILRSNGKHSNYYVGLSGHAQFFKEPTTCSDFEVYINNWSFEFADGNRDPKISVQILSSQMSVRGIRQYWTCPPVFHN